MASLQSATKAVERNIHNHRDASRKHYFVSDGRKRRSRRTRLPFLYRPFYYFFRHILCRLSEGFKRLLAGLCMLEFLSQPRINFWIGSCHFELVKKAP